MQTFRVVKEQEGWAVRVGRGMSTPFWTQERAIREARQLCASLQTHGVAAEVVIETDDAPDHDEPELRSAKRLELRLAWR